MKPIICRHIIMSRNLNGIQSHYTYSGSYEDDAKTADVAYQLRSGQAGSSGQEALQDKSSAEDGDLAGRASALVDAIEDETGTASRRPHDLRSRASPMSSAN